MTRATKLLLAVFTPLLVAAGLYATTTPASAVAYGGYDWKTISAGDSKICGIRTSGRLYCWNTDGTGSSAYSISSASDWRSVSVGRAHQCAIRGTGVLYCWGDDGSGQLGNGDVGSTTYPYRIGTASNWTSVSAGGAHTCGVLGAGYLYCWGNDGSGQLGNSTVGSKTYPYRVSSSSASWRSVSAGGAHTCGILGTGYLYCWGDDGSGQLGNGSSVGSKTYPYRVSSSATNWRSVSAGDTHTCGIAGSGTASCWGSDDHGQVGNGSGGSRKYPGLISSSARDWKTIQAGGAHTCGIRGAGYLYCWGDDTSGQVGGSTDAVQSPDLYATVRDWTVTDTGAKFSCGIRGVGYLYCWGAQKAPSTGTPAGSAYPANVLDLRRWKLTIPYDGCDAGTVADEVKWGGGTCIPNLGTYRSLNFFHTTADNKAVVFRTPVGGAKTGGSVFARTEMRERTLWNGVGGQTNCDWSNQSSAHTMRITQKVTHLPARVPRVVVGQIHDPRDEVVMIRVDGANIIAEASYPDPNYPDGRKVQKPLATGYRLGTYFTIRITAGPSGVAVYYNEGRSGEKAAWFGGRVAKNAYGNGDEPSGVVPDGWYFKAGHYLQTNTAKGESATEFGEAVLANLTISHPAGVCN